MLPGKKYRIEDLLWLARTRIWFIVIPTIVVGTATAIWSSQLPNTYSSSATILIIPQRVPESYVQSTVTASVTERLATISQQIVSRTRLERLIEEFNLYPEERKTMIMEDVVDLMRRRDVVLGNPATQRGRRNQDTTHFTVGFKSSNPRTSMQVADRLASMFVQENLQDREILADSTNQFLQAQLEDAKRRLLEHEKKLEEFRQRNVGQLPSQAQSNLQMMQMTQSQIQANNEAASREVNRLAGLEDAIADYAMSTDQPLAGEGAEAANASMKPTPSMQQLAAERAGLTELERRFKPDHPDIAAAKRRIATLEARVQQEASEQKQVPGSVTVAATPPRLVQMRMDAEQLRRSIDHRKKEDERLNRLLLSYKGRLEMSPRLESDMTELMRDYETLGAQYRELLTKSEDSKIAANLERRQIGEQFKIIDGPRLPERPISPNRLQLNSLGVLGGLMLGLGFVVLLEYRDTRLKTDDDVVMSLALPVLAVIPAMVNAVERQRARRRRTILAISASLVLVIGVAAVVAWRMRLLQAWVR